MNCRNIGYVISFNIHRHLYMSINSFVQNSKIWICHNCRNWNSKFKCALHTLFSFTKHWFTLFFLRFAAVYGASKQLNNEWQEKHRKSHYRYANQTLLCFFFIAPSPWECKSLQAFICHDSCGKGSAERLKLLEALTKGSISHYGMI